MLEQVLHHEVRCVFRDDRSAPLNPSDGRGPRSALLRLRRHDRSILRRLQTICIAKVHLR
jgi:hypothetical protein